MGDRRTGTEVGKAMDGKRREGGGKKNKVVGGRSRFKMEHEGIGSLVSRGWGVERSCEGKY